MENITGLVYEHWDENHWYLYNIPHSIDWSLKQYAEVLKWIEKNIEMPYRHARWRFGSEGIEVKFRYQRNYTHFLLSW